MYSTAKRTTSKNKMQITEFPAGLSQQKRLLGEIQGIQVKLLFHRCLRNTIGGSWGRAEEAAASCFFFFFFLFFQNVFEALTLLYFASVLKSDWLKRNVRIIHHYHTSCPLQITEPLPTEKTWGQGRVILVSGKTKSASETAKLL